MLDPDPAKRPSLDAVLMSSYLTDADRSYQEVDVDALMQAMTAYNTKVGRRVGKITEEINFLRGSIAKATPPADATTAERAEVAGKLEKWRKDLAKHEAELAAINAAPEVAPLIAAIQKASAPFH